MNLDSEDFNERENKKIKEFHNKRRSLIINLNNNYILKKKKEKKKKMNMNLNMMIIYL